MTITIALRREDRPFETRVPIVPEDVARLQRSHALRFIVQPSPERAFTDAEYQQAGAVVQEDITAADLIMGVKEIPLDKLVAGKAHMFFSHTIKGQSEQMPLLADIMAKKASLLDYECVTNKAGRRTIMFGFQAGQAGALESLRAYGQRSNHAFASIKPLQDYDDAADAKQHIQTLWAQTSATTPLVIGVTGTGNVSQGAQDILTALPIKQRDAAELASLDKPGVYICIFNRADTMRHKQRDAVHNHSDYYQNPANYKSIFPRYLPHLDILINAVYWAEPFPRLADKAALADLWQQGQRRRLQVVGDISCDPPNGSLGCTLTETTFGDPTFIYNPTTQAISDNNADGITVMSIANLPSGLAKDASRAFSRMLCAYLPALEGIDFQGSNLLKSLPDDWQSALIVQHGDLTETFGYLKQNIVCS